MYASIDDLVAAFGRGEMIDLTDREEPYAGGVVAPIADAALADAQSEVDSYLAARYAVPVSTPGARLKGAMLDIARFRLWDDRASDEVRRRYEYALTWLRDIAAGRAVLPEALPAAAGGLSGMASIVKPGRKVFNGGVL